MNVIDVDIKKLKAYANRAKKIHTLTHNLGENRK